MSRSLNDCNNQLFKLIREKGDNIVDDGNARYININKGNGKDFFLYSKLISSIKPALGLYFAVFIHKSVLYFVVAGNENPSFSFEELLPQPINEGIYITILSELNIPLLKTVSSSAVKDYYEYYDEHYDGHDFEGLLNFFPSIQIYITCIIDKNYDVFLNRMAIDYFCSNKNTTILPFTISSIDSYLYLSNTYNNLLPLDNILRSITASSWRYCFLDLYRCIENLYEIGNIYRYYDSFKSELDFNAFYNKLTKGPNIKGSELTSLDELFSLLTKQSNSMLDAIKDSSDEKNSKFIYNLRNSIVHHRPDICDIELSDDEWEQIVVYLLLCIDILYTRFQDITLRLLKN